MVKRDLDLWPHTWPWPWMFMVKFWNSCISEWEGWLTLHKGGGSRPFMTMTMTIWWPRSGVWIYQIVTGVTSVVGMPSTHLVCFLYYCPICERNQTVHSPHKVLVIQIYDAWFVVSLNKLLTKQLPVIWDTMTSMWHHYNDKRNKTHWGLVMPFGDIDLGQQWLR